jgi:hypothetical protein
MIAAIAQTPLEWPLIDSEEARCEARLEMEPPKELRVTTFSTRMLDEV